MVGGARDLVPCRGQWGDASVLTSLDPVSRDPPAGGCCWEGLCARTPVCGVAGRALVAPDTSLSYCSQLLSKEVDACVADLLKELVRFQDRMYQKDPVKAKTKRRLVLGLREVLKHLRLRKLKCVIISPNCEKIQSKGDGPSTCPHPRVCRAPLREAARPLQSSWRVTGRPGWAARPSLPCCPF